MVHRRNLVTTCLIILNWETINTTGLWLSSPNGGINLATVKSVHSLEGGKVAMGRIWTQMADVSSGSVTISPGLNHFLFVMVWILNYLKGSCVEGLVPGCSHVESSLGHEGS
jgi:hypothetical protein